jgi:endoglucanase
MKNPTWRRRGAQLAGVCLAALLALAAAGAEQSPAAGDPAPMNPSGFRIRRGTNLSHWLSQDFGWAPREIFITPADIRFIARAGFDHVRLPVDEKELWREDGSRNAAAFALLRDAIGWCRANGLRVIVDLHTLRTHHFNAANEGPANTLWSDAGAQEKFLGLWRELSAHLRDEPLDAVAYEIMNEPVAGRAEDWNRLLARAVQAIRALEPARVLVIGSNRWQNPGTFPELEIPAGDRNIILSMHTYAPLPFTHFRADWLPTRDYAGPVHYPGRVMPAADHARLMAGGDAQLRELIANAAEEWNPRRIAAELAPALRKARQLGLQLYCGEFGCLPSVARADRLAYYRDLVAVLEENHVAWANWEYKGDFGLFEWHDPQHLAGVPDVELLAALLPGWERRPPGGEQSATAPAADRIYHMIGVPRRAGSLVAGTEDDPGAFRDAGFAARLRAHGCAVVDEGDVALPSFLPHHHEAPIRNWPAPALVWDALAARLGPLLRQPGAVPLLVGCDCSVVVGSARALRGASGAVHVVYIDGDIDAAAPTAEKCQSAAASALWLLTQPSPFVRGPVLRPAEVTVTAWSQAGTAEQAIGFGSMPLDEVDALGPRAAARRVLRGIAPTAAILVHFDVDVLADSAAPVAYFPHSRGLTVAAATELLAEFACDPRTRLVEIAEYASLRDLDRRGITLLADLVGRALGPDPAVAPVKPWARGDDFKAEGDNPRQPTTQIPQ